MQVQAQCSLQLGEESGPFWVHMAASHLEGPALSHYNSVRAQRAAQGMPELSDWEEFMAVIKGGFEQYDPEDRAREALDQLRQGNRPVELHQRAFRQHLSKMKSYQLPGQEVCRLFRISLNPELQEKMAFDDNGKRYDDIDNMILMAVRKDTAKRESLREQVGGSAAGSAAGAGSSRGSRSSSRGRGSNGRRGGRSFSPPVSRQDGAARQVTTATRGEWHTVNGKRKNKGAIQQSGGGTRQQRRRGNHQGTISESFGLTSAQVQERRRNFSCYKCGSTDQFARDCPDKNKWCADPEKFAVSRIRALTNMQKPLDVHRSLMALMQYALIFCPHWLNSRTTNSRLDISGCIFPTARLRHICKVIMSKSSRIAHPSVHAWLWRKYLFGMQLLHVCNLPVRHAPGHVDQREECQRMQIFSDALPAKLLLLDHETDDEDKPLSMTFSGCLAENRATILIDNGASRNFIARKFMHRHNIVPDSEEVAEVLLADGRRICTQGSVCIVINVQDNVAHQKFTVVELPSEFDAILGDAWCRSNAVHLNFEHQECVLQREGEKFVLHAVQGVPEWRSGRAGKCTEARPHQPGKPIAHLNAMQCKRAVHKKVPMVLALVKTAEDSLKVLGTDKFDHYPDEVRDMLHEFAEVFPGELPKGVPCRPPHVRTIELQEGAVPSPDPCTGSVP